MAAATPMGSPGNPTSTGVPAWITMRPDVSWSLMLAFSDKVDERAAREGHVAGVVEHHHVVEPSW